MAPTPPQFQNVISLGQTCLSRFQINRYLINRFIRPINDTWEALQVANKQRLFGGAYPFDWCVTRDYRRLASQFRADFDSFFDLNDFSIDPIHGAYNTKTSISFDHLFSRQKNQGRNILTRETLEAEFIEKREKVLHMLDKLRKLNGSTLFIISSENAVDMEDLAQLYLGITHFLGFSSEIVIANLYASSDKVLSTFKIRSFNRLVYLPIQMNSGDDRTAIGVSSSWDQALDFFSFEPMALLHSSNLSIDHDLINSY